MRTLGEFTIEKQHEFSHATGELAALLSAIKLGAKIIHCDINKAGLVNILGASGVESVQGEVQQKPNLSANEKLKAALKARDIMASIALEEEDGIVVSEDCKRAKYTVLMDPLDGPSNIDVNVPVGAIFLIHHCVIPVGTPTTEEDFLRPGNKQAAAGYVVYGSSTILVYTTDCGVHVSTYDPSSGVFCPNQECMRLPTKDSTYSINEGNCIKFPNGVKEYIRFYQEEGKPTQRPYTSRYIGSLVADFYRNLLKGGIYLYPSTVSHLQGKLCLLYECNPMTFLVEQMGGKASDGKECTLDTTPESLYQRRSFSVGNDHVVENAGCFIHEFPDV